MTKTYRRLTRYDLAVCLTCNGLSHRRWLLPIFRFASWIGNGLLWIFMVGIVVLVYGSEASEALIEILIVTAIGVPLYRWLKSSTGRLRPYQRYESVVQLGAVLDYFSFPSGHTQQSVGFTIVLVHNFPELAWFLLPVTALIAVSRLALGLHYPSDVLAGAAIGSVLALSALSFVG